MKGKEMMTKYECAQQFLKLESLPPKQLDNLEVLERQIIDIGLRFYTSKSVNLNDLSLKDAKEKLEVLASQVQFLAKMLLVAGCDIHHFRAVSLAHFIEVPPEMQIDDIISRLTTRECDVVHDDAPGSGYFGENQNTEKGKEEGKEENSPHTPLKEKGKEEREKDPPPRARACEGSVFDGFFRVFWEEYPEGHKVAKKKCCQKLKSRYNLAKDKEAWMSQVLKGLHDWKSSPRWCDGYVCNPETFINQERWFETPPDFSSDSTPKYNFRGVSQTANVKSNRKDLW